MRRAGEAVAEVAHRGRRSREEQMDGSGGGEGRGGPDGIGHFPQE